MEILSRHLRGLDSQRQVSLHPKSAKVKLTHLVFADDLMLFTRGDVPLVTGAMGIPLNSAKNSVEVYGTLINKIQNSLLQWSNTFLSYAGRIQILNYVIFGLANFWCAIALLPKTILKRIKKICKDYFWNVETDRRKLVFQSCKCICRPQKEGGFNIKELLSWNKVLLAKWLWMLEHDSAGNWAHWYKNRKFRVALAYDWFRSHGPPVLWFKALQGPAILPKHSVTAALAALGKLPTVDLLISRGMVLINRCTLCKQMAETQRHLFFRIFTGQETKPATLIEQIKIVVKIRLLACQSNRYCIELES
ncbi:uncharacterized protein LOC141585846 [Silene latifolia]|uniref:uncharacterized protein LOC141585846 n=1 Tax=Silene latifolia TaxID=37657 RepID=UPI003D771C14